MSHIRSGPNSASMQLFALTTAATMAFSAVAQTTTPVAHPFVTNTSTAANNAVNAYRAGTLIAAKSVAEDETVASLRVANYSTMLEARLANLPEKLDFFVAPIEYTDNMFQLHGASPSSKFPGGHATMCAEQQNRVLGTWKIYLAPITYYGADGRVTASFSAGQVVPRPIMPKPATLPANAPACAGVLIDARNEIRTDHALAVQQAQAAADAKPGLR